MEQTNSLEPPVVVAIYKIYFAFFSLSIKFPKMYRYSLAQTIEQHFHLCLQNIFEANCLPCPLREMPLIKANSHCELLKLLIRMTYELALINPTQYFHLSAQLQGIGKMLGGWIKFVRSGIKNN